MGVHLQKTAAAAMAFLLAVLPGATAYAEEDIKPDRVVIYYEERNVSSANRSITVRRDEEISLEARIFPEAANVSTELTWRSSDTETAGVDQSGNVTAYEPGECTIRVRTANGKTASCRIYVPGGGASSYSSSDRRDTDPSRSSSEKAKESTVKLSGSVPREVLLNAMRLSGGKVDPLAGYASVSVETLQVASRLGDHAVAFDTLLGDTLVGRVQLRPRDANDQEPGDILLGVHSKTDKTKSIQAKFEKYYTNKITVIYCEQTHFPIPAEIMAPATNNSGGDLQLYLYDKSSNKVTRASDVSNLTKDSSGYVHVITQTGGYLIVSDGPLKRKS